MSIPKNIRVLTISDYETSGVGGCFENNLYTLVRTRGTSAKLRQHAGSFVLEKMSTVYKYFQNGFVLN